MYKSKLNFWRVYIPCIIASFFFIVAAYVLINPELLSNNKIPSKRISPVFFIILFELLSLVIIYPIIKRTSKVFIEDNYIRIKFFFKSIVLNVEDIASIELNARKNGTMFDAEYKLGGIQITSQPGKIYFLPDKYFNSGQILKQKLDFFCKTHNTIHLIQVEKKEKDIKNNSVSVEEETFSGNYLTSANGIMLIVMEFFFCGMAFKGIMLTKQNWAYFAIPFIILMWYCIFSIIANYFVFSNTTFIIRNHLFFWKRRSFEINEIDQVFFESTQKTSNSLRIVLKDYNQNRYYAGSLRNMDWLRLKSRFKELGISITSDVNS